MTHSEPTEGADLGQLLERIEQLMLGGPRSYTRGEVAERAGVELTEATALWRALGFAGVGDEEVVFTDLDLQALRAVRELRATGIADDELLRAITRMLGQALSRLASGQGQLIVEMLAQHPEVLHSEEQVRDLFATLIPLMGQVQDYVWRRQLVAYFTRVTSATDTPVPAMAPLAVGFADMSGFTTLTRKATAAELAALLEAFEATGTEVVAAHGGRIVKTIGDEILFVAGDAGRGAEIALDLLARSAADARLPPLRVGLAYGPVVSRLGDVYGSTVNIASRLTSVARAGWLLVDRMMAAELEDDPRYRLRARRPESVRGFHRLRSWRLSRADDVTSPHRRPGHAAGRR